MDADRPPEGRDSDPCTVIVTVDAADPAVIDDMERHARLGLRLFTECAGFLSGTLHRSVDGTRMVQVVQWTTERDYERCRDDPRWDGLESTRTFFDHVRAGRARVDPRVFRVRARALPET